ncbi:MULTISPECIES: GIY-YIG nuclease family protein [unclassified Clostridium]|uniref:GIY-YIG nuclease family protein n=1 Tax=unclassified Clostridium TaxID=2614128 RepID=UPI002079BB98|nr:MULTISPECIES: GIY-YIG nuclease family protein [unclassified Clostridium]
MNKKLSSKLNLALIVAIISAFIPYLGFISAIIIYLLSNTLKKELLNYTKTIQSTEDELETIKSNLDNEYSSINKLKFIGQIKAKAIIDAATTEAKNILTSIDNKIQEKIKYAEEVDKLTNQYENLVKKVDREKNKLSKIKSLYSAIEYTSKKYAETDIFNDNLSLVKLTGSAKEYLGELSPTINLKLHNMDIKELRKAFKNNDKLITETLIKYEKRYTTKANLAVYRLMVIALRAEQQNMLYNLKFDKLEKTIDDIKSISIKYLTIAEDGNKQIFGTIAKFINEIEYLFIKSAEIEYEYYVKKEKQKEEQALLREQMKQEAEERKLLQQQQKQVEKEEEKYKLEIEKVQEQLAANSDDDEKLKQLQLRIAELQDQLECVEHKKDEIVSRQNGKAGYVYVISNLGSFGNNVFKVGMTRRLDPMDRINELGSASVPFSFDVHSFIFSDDAVSLEQKLHNILDINRVNKINLRKEFFRIDIDELENIVEEIDPSAEFNKTMLAEQYRQTLSLNEENQIA